MSCVGRSKEGLDRTAAILRCAHIPNNRGMKISLELPDTLLRRTKAAAAMRGVSMRDFIAQALEVQLRRRALNASGSSSELRSSTPPSAIEPPSTPGGTPASAAGGRGQAHSSNPAIRSVRMRSTTA